MKTCHICDNIVKTTRVLACLACKRGFCYPCLIKFFPQTSSQYIPKTPADALKQPKTKQCFYCLRQCKCTKCVTSQAIVVSFGFPGSNEGDPKEIVINTEETNPVSALFHGKKLSELPDYLQRIYAKKKVIYTKHQLSQLKNQNVPPEVLHENPDESENKPLKKGQEKGQAQQIDLEKPAEEQQVGQAVQAMQMEKLNEEADVEGSQNASRSRSASEGQLSSKGEGEEGEQEDEDSSQGQMVDENELGSSQQDNRQDPQQGSSRIQDEGEIPRSTSKREDGRIEPQGEDAQE